MQHDKYVVYCDNQSAIDLRKNATYYSRTKHIEVRYHLIRDAIELKRFQLKKINTSKNAVDMMTKVVPRLGVLFQARRHRIPLRIQGDFYLQSHAWVWRGRFYGVHTQHDGVSHNLMG